MRSRPVARFLRYSIMFVAIAATALTACEFATNGNVSRSASGAIVVPTLPSLGDTMALHADIGRTPEGAVKVFLLACMQYGSRNLSEHSRGREAIRRLSIEYMDDSNWDSLTTAQTFVERLDTKTWIFRSYAAGTSPQNNYAMNPGDFTLNVTKVEDGGTGGRDVWLQSTGADSPRRVYLKRGSQDGLYYLEHFGNLYVDIRQPVAPGQQTFE